MTHSRFDDWMTDARALIAKGDFRAATEILRQATTADPSHAEAWKALGVAENKLGNHQDAERHLAESLRLDASDADAWSSLGGVYVALGRYDTALTSFERGLAAGSVDSYSLLNCLTMAAITGDYDASLQRHASALRQARADCEAQIAQADNVPWCYYDVAQIEFFERAGDVGGYIREALGRSNEWQAASARRTYELLAKSGRFAHSAGDVLAEFTRQEGTHGSGTGTPAT